MCSKSVCAKATKSASLCSSPRKIGKCKQDKTSRAKSQPLSSALISPIVLLFEAHALCAQVCCAPRSGVPPELLQPSGIHLENLRNVFAQGLTTHYEWIEETQVHRTTLLPFTDQNGRISEVLSITRDISTWNQTTGAGVQTLHDGSVPKTFAQMLLAARENEKREIAKALHDEIGTASVMLSALVNLTKQSIKKGNTPQALKDLQRLQMQTQQSMERLRNIIVTLRPPSLDTDGALRGNLEGLLKDVCALGQISYQFVCARNMREKGICDRVKILVYRLVQEALSNVLKHAHATCVNVELKRIKQTLFISVRDNGIGFVRSKHCSIHHIGLRSMQDSIRLLGGHFEIVSAPGQGTLIKVSCPCVVYEENP